MLYSSWLTLFHKEVVQHMCNPLWLIPHQHWLNHTSAYKSSDWLQKQESIKKHCLSQTRGSWYICFLFIHPHWKLNVYRTVPIKIHHAAACEPGHGAVSEPGHFPPASCPALSDHRRHPAGAERGSPAHTEEGLCPGRVHVLTLQVTWGTQGLCVRMEDCGR